MTTTAENTAQSGEAAAGTGRVARVIGPVVDVEFPAEGMPEIYFALHGGRRPTTARRGR